MDFIMTSNKALRFTTKTAVNGLAGLGIGYITGSFAGVNALKTGLVFGAVFVIKSLANSLVNALGRKFNWKPSTVKLINACTDFLTSMSLSVSMVAFGIFGTIGIAISSGLSLIFFASEFASAAKLRQQEINDEKSVMLRT